LPLKKKQPEVAANKTTTAKPKPQLQIAPNHNRVLRSNISNKNNNNNQKLQLTNHHCKTKFNTPPTKLAQSNQLVMKIDPLEQ
jgi:hypothetical protein